MLQNKTQVGTVNFRLYFKVIIRQNMINIGINIAAQFSLWQFLPGIYKVSLTDMKKSHEIESNLS